MSERAWKLIKTPSYENLSMSIKNLPLHWMKAFSFWRLNPWNHLKAAADMCFPSAASNLERVAWKHNTINHNDPLWFLDWILWNQSTIMNVIVLVEFDGGESRNILQLQLSLDSHVNRIIMENCQSLHPKGSKKTSLIRKGM